MKYYVNHLGEYQGGWDENPPSDLIEVPEAPVDSRQIWALPNGPWGIAPPVSYILPVAVFWIRFEDDEEVESFENAMDSATPRRLRNAFRSAQTMHSEGELFGFVSTVLSACLGSQRANQIMADPTGENAAFLYSNDTTQNG